MYTDDELDRECALCTDDYKNKNKCPKKITISRLVCLACQITHAERRKRAGRDEL